MPDFVYADVPFPMKINVAICIVKGGIGGMHYSNLMSNTVFLHEREYMDGGFLALGVKSLLQYILCVNAFSPCLIFRVWSGYLCVWTRYLIFCSPGSKFCCNVFCP